jgi:hypothetical protein
VPDLLILIKRAPDGSAALTCIRADETRTWQKQPGSVGMLLPFHDLTHYAVETSLRYRRGFYGLIAEGWDIGDFVPPYPRGPVPREAREAELVVSVFEMELRNPGWAPATIREEGERYSLSGRSGREGITLPELSDADIDRVRTTSRDLFRRWAETGDGETLQLEFNRSGI